MVGEVRERKNAWKRHYITYCVYLINFVMFTSWVGWLLFGLHCKKICKKREIFYKVEKQKYTVFFPVK